MLAPSKALVWIDMEMTGLDPEANRIIEVATIITNAELEEVAVGPNLTVHQPDDHLATMDDWNTRHHAASGLTALVRASTLGVEEVEAQTLTFINAHIGAGDGKQGPVLAGNSIHQDRRFIQRYMKKLDARLHYRMVDVSTIKELAQRWYSHDPTKAKPKAKAERHRALDDIRESIAELRFYRDHLFVPNSAPAPTPG